MVQDEGDGPKESIRRSWVRGSRKRTDESASAGAATAETATAEPTTAETTTEPLPPSPAPPGLDDGPAASPGLAVDGRDDLDVTLSWPGAGEDRSSAPDSGLDELGDDHVAAVPAVDDHDDVDADADGDDLLPAVPLLPTIAGRVDALGALLRTIAMRVDSLAATTNAFRSAVTDSIDEYAEVVTATGRQGEQNLDDYRRSTERTVAELRRGLAEHEEMLHRATARLEELSTDVATLVDLVRLSVSEQRARPVPPDGVTASDDPALAEQLAAVRDDLNYLRGMIDVVVDTMPASTEGSAAPGLADHQLDRIVDRLATASAAPVLADHQLDRIVDRLATRLLSAATPPPASTSPATRAPAPKPVPSTKPRARPSKAAPTSTSTKKR